MSLSKPGTPITSPTEGSGTPEFFLEEKEEEEEEEQRRTSDLLTFPWSQQQALKMPESHHYDQVQL